MNRPNTTKEEHRETNLELEKFHDQEPGQTHTSLYLATWKKGSHFPFK
jgi:hypothetical protein